MTWLAWRLFRVPAVSVYVGLAMVGILLAITGPNLVGRTSFDGQMPLYGGTILAMYLLPAVVGVFWGVPMVTRELETGTHCLVWNQTVSRGRWLGTKLWIGVLAAMVAAGLLSLGVSWWASPIDGLASREPDASMLTRMSPVVFGARGIVPVGYAAVALVLGVAVAIVLRRTVAAMAVTLVVLAAVLVATPVVVRQHLLPATEETVTITENNIRRVVGDHSGAVESMTVANPPGAWVLANETVSADGTAVSPLPAVVRSCLSVPGDDARPPERQTVLQCLTRLTDHGYQQRLVYQPASHFWPLQWLETAMLLALSALLTWFCLRRLRHLS